MDPARRAFYQFHATLMEPWDGPACVTFTDGTLIGAVLDRNGLRPGRYWVTDDGLVVLASEVGVLDIDPATGRPQGPAAARPDVPGRHRRSGRIVEDDEIKAELAAEQPVRRVAARRPDRTSPTCPSASTSCTPTPRSPAASRPSATPRRSCGSCSRRWPATGAEPIGSMGTDTPIAVLSDRPRLLFDYFTQLFAQVTNPPLDAIREELVTSLGSRHRPGGQPARADRRRPAGSVALPFPVIDNDELAKLVHINADGDLPGLRRPPRSPASTGSPAAARRCAARLDRDLRRGRRGHRRTAPGSSCCPTATPTPSTRPIPSLLLTSAVHHHLIREQDRAPRSACSSRPATSARCTTSRCCIGYGAAAVNPYLAMETVEDLVRGRRCSPASTPRRPSAT